MRFRDALKRLADLVQHLHLHQPAPELELLCLSLGTHAVAGGWLDRLTLNSLNIRQIRHCTTHPTRHTSVLQPHSIVKHFVAPTLPLESIITVEKGPQLRALLDCPIRKGDYSI
ncbi:MAG TPA: hypothetical protein EYM39_04865 [Candidatus Latescibacteria bacterium]|nr:hypothetical protein [Candidatus Latescibacterota bacterium]